jgi:hypothetical protein
MAFKPVYLEPDEEITNVIDKIKSSPDQQIALVLAKNSGLFQSLVNLKLLSKEAKNSGKSVVLITTNKVGQRLAGQVGITTYGALGAIAAAAPVGPTSPAVPTQPDEVINGVKVKQYDPNRPVTTEPTDDSDGLEQELAKDDLAEKRDQQPVEQPVEAESTKPAAADTPTPPPPERSQADLPAIISRGGFKQNREFKIPWKSVAVGAGIFLLLILLAVVFIPRAVVTVTFPAFPLTETVAVSAVVNLESAQNNTITGNKLTTEKTKTDQVTATGKKDVGTKATGSVTITNKYTDGSGAGRDQTFAAGTKVTHSASKKVFTLNNSVTVGKVTYNPNNGQPIYQSKSASVTALEPGEDYNVAAGSLTIAGALSNTPVTSSTAFSGGLTKVVTILSQDDVDGAILKLRQAAKEEAVKELETKAQGQKILADAIWEDVSEEGADKEIGSEVANATVRVDIEYGVIVFNENDANSVFTAAFSGKVTDDEEIVFPEDKLPKFTAKETTKGRDRLNFEISGTAYKVPKIDKVKIAKSITKKTTNSVEELLKQDYKAEQVNVALSPSWWVDRMPLLSSEIRIEYGFNEGATDSPKTEADQ